MSHEEFFNTYFTGQKELSVMAAMSPAERAQFLSRVLGYERLRTAQGLIRERRRSIVAEATGLRAGMADPAVVQRALTDATARRSEAVTHAKTTAARRDGARRALDEIAPRWSAIQRERDAMQALIAELRVAEGERGSLQRDEARLNRELAETAAAKEELDRVTGELSPLAALQIELRELDRACNEEGRRKTLIESESALGADIVQIRERLLKIESAPTLEPDVTAALEWARAELEHSQREFEERRTDWVRDQQEAETKRQSLLEQLQDVQRQREQIVELGEGGTCPICARPLGTHFRSVLDVLDQQIESITVDGKYYRGRIEQLQQTPPELGALEERRRAIFENITKLERRLAKVQAAMQELATLTRDLGAKEERYVALSRELASIAVEYDAARHAEVRALVDRLTPLAERATKLAGQIERERVLLDDRERTRGSLRQIESRLAMLSAQRDSLAFSEESYADLRLRHEQAAADLRASELAAVGADSELAAAVDALEVAESARAELLKNEAHLELLTKDRRLHEELDRAFTDLRTDLNLTLRPEISDLASRYIRELTDGRYSEIELDDQYNVTVLEDAIPKPVISGGEEDLANLVLRLAISEMIAERAGQAFSLLILDEVFGSLDEARRHNVVDLLRRLQDRFEQVILITHIDSVRDGLDRVVSVRYDEEAGISRVEAESAGGVALDMHAGAAD
ncbi:MAG TPA: SMC family ATPase [Gemmatimonadaceae bacterium]